MIVPFAPGGASDVVARIIAPKLGDVLGQQIVIENRSGASGNIGMEAAAQAAPDGYTIFLGNIGTIAINPAIFRNLSVNPVKDFIAVTQVADVPSMLVANPGVPANSVAELVALREGESGRAQLRLDGIGRAEPAGDGAVPEGRRHRRRAHPVQGRRGSRGDRHARRRDARHVRHARVRRRASSRPAG